MSDRADLFQQAAEWIGPSTADEATGLELLLRRYLGGFGPARLADAAAGSSSLMPPRTPWSAAPSSKRRLERIY